MSRPRPGDGLPHRIVRALPAPLSDVVTAAFRRSNRRVRPVRWGNLRRQEPFSPNYGSSRGTPVGRVYIDRFLRRHAGSIGGRTLEVKEDLYATAFGADAVEVVDIDRSNPAATLITDLGEPGSLPSARYDTVICTQTLHYLPDPVAGCANIWQSLRPGGTLLVTVPCLSPLEPDAARDSDHRRFTPAGFRDVIARGCTSPASAEIVDHGNLTVAVSNLLGIAAEELTDEELDHHDPRYPIVVCGAVTKAQ